MTIPEFLLYQLIISHLRKVGAASLDDLRAHLRAKSQYRDYLEKYSDLPDSSFRRYRDKIRQYFACDIRYSAKDKGYHISHEGPELEDALAALQRYELARHIQLADKAKEVIFGQRPSGDFLQLLTPLFDAIQARQKVSFQYRKFWEHEGRRYFGAPYMLKEHEQRWYLILRKEDGALRSFGLDRMSQLKTHVDERFEAPKDFVPAEHFKHCFGIISPTAAEGAAEEIVLRFAPYQGNYIKSLPLHHSQKTLSDCPQKGLIVSLFLYNTLDLRMKILSYGADCEVISPPSLRQQIAGILRQSLKAYES